MSTYTTSTCAFCGGPVYRYHPTEVVKMYGGQDCWHVNERDRRDHFPKWTDPTRKESS